MRQASRDLWYALLAIILITLVYVLLAVPRNAVPASSSLFGHILGVIGFIFMLMTELLYSLRKHSRQAARWGRMESWLKFHIFTGVVGPYMVFLHTAWHFQGLAGAVTLMTVIVVGSGFVGRYIYTLIPRTAAGVEVGGVDLEYYRKATESELQSFLARNPAVIRTLPQDLISMPQIPHSAWSLIIGRIFKEFYFSWRWWRETRGITRKQSRDLKKLLDVRRNLHYRITSLLLARRILASWHAIHMTLGIVLFTTAFIHIGAAVYYVSFTK